MSTIRAASIVNLAGTGPVTNIGTVPCVVFGCVDMSVPALLGSFNVSSLTDGGTGQPILNMTNAMASRYDYAASAGSALYSSGVPFAVQLSVGLISTTNLEGRLGSNTSAQSDHHEATLSAVGDLA